VLSEVAHDMVGSGRIGQLAGALTCVCLGVLRVGDSPVLRTLADPGICLGGSASGKRADHPSA